MTRQIKGIFFIDYVRMIKSRRDVDWTRHLEPRDAEILSGRIEPGAWYALDSFERMGLGILEEIASGSMEAVHEWGRRSMDGLSEAHAMLVVPGDPMESLMRFQVLRSSFFNFAAVELAGLMGNEVVLRIDFGMSRRAEEASAHQTLGFFERLLELAGARDVRHEVLARSWEEKPPTVIRLMWR